MNPEGHSDRGWITSLIQESNRTCTVQGESLRGEIGDLREDLRIGFATVRERLDHNKEEISGNIKAVYTEMIERTEKLNKRTTVLETVRETEPCADVKDHVDMMHRPWTDRLWNLMLAIAAGVLGWVLGKGH